MPTIEETADKLVSEGLSAILEPHGFVLRKKRGFKRKIEKCEQELNVQLRQIRGQDAGYVQVCPGFRYEALEVLVADLSGEKLRKGWPSAAANIGNLKPQREFLEWPLTNTTDIFALSNLICSCIREYAFPFWDEFSTINGLVKGYESEDSRLTLAGNSYRWRMSAAYCLQGNHGAAVNVLERWEKGRPSQAIIEQAIRKISNLT
ncbi:Hypothetical protein LUCI_5207 [Lucifera butyrica]|uniref:Uncharacterized protein n=1 Tax=Lucifera butyrica TaxID=1351585 RepID=A0A498RF08_9FIRM|nr:hypothetical protein [Lucifera butyrica]VBB09909.1 Hypothetical protein LUCI_5207 [Lucifera butyrica]